MAFPEENGDISQITELGHFDIPGAGHNRIGQAKNNKTVRWGRIVGLYNSTGLNLTRYNVDPGKALGVSVLDHVTFEVRSAGAASAVFPTSLKGFLATLKDDGKIFICDEVGNTDPTVPSNGDVITLDYVVTGETYTAPELV
jgi:hypothetical protein